MRQIQFKVTILVRMEPVTGQLQVLKCADAQFTRKDDRILDYFSSGLRFEISYQPVSLYFQ